MYATGVGSLPGTDMPAALRRVLGSFSHAWLPELPARGVGADMVGRATALLVGLGVDLQPQGWRLTDASGIDHERARSLLRRDLDDLEEHAQAFTGSMTLTVAGPWTLAACLERSRGDKVLADHGARREVAESLGLGLAQLLAELHRRLPAIAFGVQLDEPLLPDVLDGRVATASGFSRLRPVDRPAASELLGRLLVPVVRELSSQVPDGGAVAVSRLALHCCAAWPGGVDTELLGRAGLTSLVLDASRLHGADWDRLGPWLERGHELRLGLAPTTIADRMSSADELVTSGLALLRPLGLDPRVLDDHLAITSACGLAGWSLGAASRQLDALLQAAELLPEQLQRWTY